MLKLDKTKIGTKETIVEISDRDVAIIGLSVQMPMADDIDSFWNNIVRQVDCVRDIPYTRVPDSNLFANLLFGDTSDKTFSNAAYLKRVDGFDYRFFGISPKEASLMSPQQRLFLQSTYQAIEDSGNSPDELKGSRTGIYLGYEADDPFDYKRYISELEPESLNISGTGNLTSIIAGRVAYMLDFKGLCLSVDTACSSSLVALHLACKAIRDGTCSMALVGSVRINLLPIKNQLNFGANSSDGKARTFDDSSDGTGSGEGVVTVLLKPLGSAMRDKDPIYAVIKGSACNQDGSSVGLTAPNVLAQRDVLIDAWKDAEVAPETISYIEAHGTGTKLGDPIEIDAMKKAFAAFTNKKQFCAVGSIKTNMGHLDNAAGLTGLVKAALSLYNKRIPGMLHFNIPNRNIQFEESPVYVNDITRAWDSDAGPRRCGVSSFGFSGTNCHVVLEEAPADSHGRQLEDGYFALLLSAACAESLERLADVYIGFLDRHPKMNVGDICYTAAVGRSHHKFRLAIVARNLMDMKNKLIQYREKQKVEGVFYSGMTDKILLNINKSMFFFPCVEFDDNLRNYCYEYIMGNATEPERYFQNSKCRRVHLPPYQFRQDRCWVSPKPGISEPVCTPFYTMKWESEPYAGQRRAAVDGVTLIFRTSHTLGIELKKLVSSQKRRVMEVVFDSGQQSGPDRKDVFYMARHPVLADWNALKAWMNSADIVQVIHATALFDYEEPKSRTQLQQRLQDGVLNALRALQVVLEGRENKKMQVVFITNYADQVDGTEIHLNPENAAVHGFAHCLRWEHAAVDCLCIDIDETTTAEDIADELLGDKKYSFAAYRGNKRYTRKMQPIDTAATRYKEINLKRDGVYLIVGGTGGIGMHLTKALRYENVNIALISRAGRNCFAENDMNILDNPTCTSLQKALERGQVISYHTADLSDYKQVESLVITLRKVYVNIRGVIHCAGVSEGNVLLKDTVERYERVFAAKVYGTWNLAQLTHNDPLDFFVCFSSAITFLGGIGSGAYTAANCYLDSFASTGALQGKRYITINWPVWRDTGMAENMQYYADKELFHMLNPHDGVYAFFQALGREENRFIAGSLNHQSVVLHLKDLQSFSFSEGMITNHKKQKPVKNKVKQASKTLNFTEKVSADYEEIAKDIVFAWSEVLGYETVDAHANFFSLGGDSILMTRVQELLQDKYQVSMADLFSYPTIMTLAKYLAGNVDLKKPKDHYVRRQMLEIVYQVQNHELSVEQALQHFYTTENEL